MTTRNVERISETLGANLGVLIIAGGEPFTRKDLPEIARAFYKNNKLESIYLMSNGQIQQRIIPDVTRILEECPNLNVTVALGIDGLKEDHESIRQKPGSWDIAIDTARKLQEIKKEYPRLDIQTCTCFMNSNQDRIFEWYDFLKHDLKPDKVNFNYIRPPSARPKELIIDKARYDKLSHMISEDSRHAAIKNNYAGDAGFFKAAIDIYMHELDREDRARRPAAAAVLGGNRRRGDLRRRHGFELRDSGSGRQTCATTTGTSQKLWYSPAMDGRRETVANGCFCTHESNCYYPSLPFNPTHLVEIKTDRERDEGSASACRTSSDALALQSMRRGAGRLV